MELTENKQEAKSVLSTVREINAERESKGGSYCGHRGRPAQAHDLARSPEGCGGEAPSGLTRLLVPLARAASGCGS